MEKKLSICQELQEPPCDTNTCEWASHPSGSDLTKKEIPLLWWPDKQPKRIKPLNLTPYRQHKASGMVKNSNDVENLDFAAEVVTMSIFIANPNLYMAWSA